MKNIRVKLGWRAKAEAVVSAFCGAAGAITILLLGPSSGIGWWASALAGVASALILESFAFRIARGLLERKTDFGEGTAPPRDANGTVLHTHVHRPGTNGHISVMTCR